MQGGQTFEVGLVGKLPSHIPPFNLHGRTGLVFKNQMAGADLSYFPVGRGFKADPVPGDFFPVISQFSDTDLVIKFTIEPYYLGIKLAAKILDTGCLISD